MANKKPAGKKPAKADGKPQKSVLDAELSNDEKLLWSHRPGAMAFALAHARAGAMGMPFIMLGLIWNGMVMKTVSVPYVGIFTWLFAAVGVLYLCIPAVAYLRGKIYVFYALTNKRLIILSMFPKHEVQSFPIKSVNRVFTKDITYGVGSLIIDAPGAQSKNPAKARAGFYGVPYISRVEDAFNMLKDPEATRKAAAEQARAQQAREREATNTQAASFAPSSSAAPSPPEPAQRSSAPAAPSSQQATAPAAPAAVAGE